MEQILIMIVLGVAGVALGIFLSASVLRKKLEKKSQLLLVDAQEKSEIIKKRKNPAG